MTDEAYKHNDQEIIDQLKTFGYDQIDITEAMMIVHNKTDINEIIDAINTSKEMQTISYNYEDDEKETWIPLKDVPFRSYFIAFRGTILAISYKSKHGYWGDGIYIYNIDNNIWGKFITYPDYFESTLLSIALNKHTKELYGYTCSYCNTLPHIKNNNQILSIINLKKKTFSEEVIKTDMGMDNLNCASTVFIEDKYHLFVGNDYRKHFILSKQFEFIECCNSIPLGANYHGRMPWSVMYAQNKRMIIFGGNYDSWMKKVPLYCYEMKGKHVESCWKKVLIELPNQKETVEICTRELSYCYHEKSENILIFDGLSGKHIYIVNINDFKVRESEILCPENKIYDVLFVSHMSENEKIVMGYIRKYVGIEQLPYDILNEIANWMEGFDCVHVFDKNRGLCHWVIDVMSIVQ
eukprot:465154_1